MFWKLRHQVVCHRDVWQVLILYLLKLWQQYFDFENKKHCLDQSHIPLSILIVSWKGCPHSAKSFISGVIWIKKWAISKIIFLQIRHPFQGGSKRCSEFTSWGTNNLWIYFCKHRFCNPLKGWAGRDILSLLLHQIDLAFVQQFKES